ncbi:MAG TPA: caspase family protein [Syntrophales bacterium]|nr:caspase family protein [Syntrophales bacterium]
MHPALRFLSVASILLITTACGTLDASYNRAILRLESTWLQENIRILESDGRRQFKATKQQAFEATQLTARRLGMVVDEQNFTTGYMLVSAPAPTPLTMEEWAEVQKKDTEKFQSIIAQDIGAISYFATLDPSGKDVVGNFFISEKEGLVEVSIGLRLRSTKPTADKLRRLQAPPTAVRMGVQKFWKAFEPELASVVGRGAPADIRPAALPAKKYASSPKGETQKAALPGGNRYAVAVIIGNKDYGDRAPAVDYAYNDAEAMKQFFVEVLGVSDSNIISLRDVTRADMEVVFGNDRTHKGKLWQWVRPQKSDVFVYYSGHGVPGLKDGREYLWPVDGNLSTPEIFGYPLQLLYKNLDMIEARSVTVFIDACFSGESSRGTLIRGASGVRVTPKKSAEATFTIVTATSPGQVASWDDETGRGLFTKHLLDALKGAADEKPYGNGDGRITLNAIKNYLDNEMTYAARRRYAREQQATVFGEPDSVIVNLRR